MPEILDQERLHLMSLVRVTQLENIRQAETELHRLATVIVQDAESWGGKLSVNGRTELNCGYLIAVVELERGIE